MVCAIKRDVFPLHHSHVGREIVQYAVITKGAGIRFQVRLGSEAAEIGDPARLNIRPIERHSLESDISRPGKEVMYYPKTRNEVTARYWDRIGTRVLTKLSGQAPRSVSVPGVTIVVLRA